MREKNNAFLSSMILAILFVVFGLLLLIFPDAVINIIAYVLAVGVGCLGIYGLYKFFLSKDESNYSRYGLAYGILFIILALFIIFRKSDIVKILPYTVGAIMLIVSTLKVDYILILKKNNNENWKVTCAVTIICFLLGIILLFFPIQGLSMVVRIIGLVIVFYSILDIINTYIIKTNIEKAPSVYIEQTVTVTKEPEQENETVKEAIIKEEKPTVEKQEQKKAPVKKQTAAKPKTVKKDVTKKPVKKTATKKTTKKEEK